VPGSPASIASSRHAPETAFVRIFIEPQYRKLGTRTIAPQSAENMADKLRPRKIIT
jgi:hypothetical protein